MWWYSDSRVAHSYKRSNVSLYNQLQLQAPPHSESHYIPFTHAHITTTLRKRAEILFSIATAFKITVSSHVYYRQISVHFEDAKSMNSKTVLLCTTYIGVNMQDTLVTHIATDEELWC